MKVWIDADACPKAVKEVIFRAAQKRGFDVVVVANKAMHVPAAERIRMIQVAGGPDVADDHIAEHAGKGDVAITADIPLAARLVDKRVIVITPRGEELDEENVGERLSMRDFMTDLRDVGVMTGGPKAFSDRDKNQFANALDRALTKAGR
jgi:uncharacterized protein YaiI (UPF0178 family)